MQIFLALLLLLISQVVHAADAITPNLGLILPEVQVDDVWGARVNSNFTLLDAQFPGGPGGVGSGTGDLTEVQGSGLITVTSGTGPIPIVACGTCETTAGAQAKVDVHVNDTTAAHAASAISAVPFGTIEGTTVQAQLEEIFAEAAGGGGGGTGDIDGVTAGSGLTGGGTTGTVTLNVGVTTPLTVTADAVECPTCETTAGAQTKVDTHVNDTSAAHAATAISAAPFGSIAGTTVQAQLEEIVAEVSGYSDEQAQDAVGAILTDTATINLTYTDATPSMTADVIANSIGPTQIDETGNYVFTGTLVTTTVVASLGTATNGVFKVVTDADPDCATGGGTTIRLCRGNGTDWDTIGDSTGSTPTLEEVSVQGRSNLTANSLANAERVGDATNQWCRYRDAALGLLNVPCTPTDVRQFIQTNQTGGFKYEDSALDLELIKPDAASTLLMWSYPNAAYRPKKSIWFGAGSLSTDGTQCAAPAEVTLASGPKTWTIVCADNDGSTIYGNIRMPDSWDGGTITFGHGYVQTAANTGALNGDIAAQCKGLGEAVTNSWGTEVAIDDAAVTGTNAVDQTTSAAVTPTGSCAGGDMLWFRYQVDATGTTTTAASLHHLGFNLEYSILSRSD